MFKIWMYFIKTFNITGHLMFPTFNQWMAPHASTDVWAKAEYPLTPEPPWVDHVFLRIVFVLMCLFCRMSIHALNCIQMSRKRGQCNKSSVDAVIICLPPTHQRLNKSLYDKTSVYEHYSNKGSSHRIDDDMNHCLLHFSNANRNRTK